MQWHRRYGVLVARGPGIKRDQLVFGASLLDVAPTVLSLMGLSAGDMDGLALADSLQRPSSRQIARQQAAAKALDPVIDALARESRAEVAEGE